MPERNTEIRYYVAKLRGAIAESAAAQGHKDEVLQHLDALDEHINYVDALRYETLIDIPYYYCPHCGSADVQEMSWVDVQTRRVIDAVAEGDDSHFCNACERHSEHLEEDDPRGRTLSITSLNTFGAEYTREISLTDLLETYQNERSIDEMRSIADLVPPTSDAAKAIDALEGHVVVMLHGRSTHVTRVD